MKHIVLLLSLVASPALAGDVFHFYGVCERNCARFGLADGQVYSQRAAMVLKGNPETLTLQTLHSFKFLGHDFRTGANLLRLATPTGFNPDGTLSGFVLTGVRDGKVFGFCYNMPAPYFCQSGTFNTFMLPGAPAVQAAAGQGELWVSRNAAPLR